MEEKERRRKKTSTSDRERRRQKTSYRQEAQDEERRKRVAASKHRHKKRSVKRKKRRKKKSMLRFLPLVLVLLLVCIGIYLAANHSEATKMNTKGIEAYDAADYETSISYFSKAIERDSLNGTYWMNQGMAYSELKMYDNARESFARAEELMRSAEDKQLLNRAEGISMMYQGNYTEAIDLFDAALDGKESRFTQTEIDILYYKAEALDKAGKYVDAALVYGLLVDTERSADAYMLRGMEYMKVGDYSGAEADLRMAIKKDKKNYDTYLALYEALDGQGKTEQANEVLQEALKIGGNKGTALVSQGEIYLLLGDFEAAEAKLTKALGKGEISANLGMAEFYMEKTEPDYSKAVEYFETYFAAVTDDAEAYNAYGLCLITMENYDKAEEIFTKGVALNDRLMTRTLSKNQIIAAEKAGHWDKALEYIEVYLQKYSDDAEALKEKQFIETRVR